MVFANKAASRAEPTLLERAVYLQQSLDPESSSYMFQVRFAMFD